MPHAPRLALLVLAASGVVLLGGCMANQNADHTMAHNAATMPATAPAETTLYASLGGDAGISNIADDLVTRMQSDDALQSKMSKIDVDSFKADLKAKGSELTGGPDVYLGKDVKSAAAGMGITDTQWNAFIKDLTDALNDQKVPPLAREELLVKVQPMKADVVGQ